MPCDHPPLCPPACTHCLAWDRHTRALCTQAPSGPTSKWCPEHEMLQAKMLKSYKRYTLAAEAFDDTQLPPNYPTILQEITAVKLEEWNSACRQKHGLLQRVIQARAEHHQLYYNGGDWGHGVFVESLKSECDRLERFMSALDRRAYAIALARQEAEWVLTAASSNFICDEPVPAAPLTPPATPPSEVQELPGTGLNKNQRKKAHRKARKMSASSTSSSSELDFITSLTCCESVSFGHGDPHARALAQLEALRAYLVAPQDLPGNIDGLDWYELIATLFRYVILRTPTLAPLGLSSDLLSVEAFLDLLERRIDTRCGDEIGKLWRAMKFETVGQPVTTKSRKKKLEDSPPLLGVGVIGDAIADIFRAREGSPGVFVSLLGGKVYKEPSPVDIPPAGWDLFYQFIACAGCGLALTRTFTSFTRNRRLALLGAYPAWLTPMELPAEHIFRMASIALNGSNMPTAGLKVKRVDQKDESNKRGKAKKIVSIEEWERPWIYIRLPLSAAWSMDILDTLSTMPERFSLLARNADTGVTTHSPCKDSLSFCQSRGCKCCTSDNLWLSAVRTGMTTVDRKSARWTMSHYFPSETVLDSFGKTSHPEQRHGYKYTDVYEALVMDNRSYAAVARETGNTWKTFINTVAAVVVRTAGCEDYDGLMSKMRAEARETGELPSSKGSSAVASTKDKDGIRYATIEENLTARKMFREQW